MLRFCNKLLLVCHVAFGLVTFSLFIVVNVDGIIVSGDVTIIVNTEAIPVCQHIYALICVT